MLATKSVSLQGFTGTTGSFPVSCSSRILICLCSASRHGNQIIWRRKTEVFGATLKLNHRKGGSLRKDMATYTGVESGSSLPVPDPSSPGSWKFWLLGMLITVVIPFWRNKWWPLTQLKEKVDSVMDTAEDIAEMVEKVAEGVDKAAEDLAEHLPAGGKLREAVERIENAAEQTAKGAHLADQFFEKVDEIEEDAETFLKTVIGRQGQANAALLNKEVKPVTTEPNTIENTEVEK